MDLAHAIIAAQVRLNEITNNDKRVCIIHRGIQENDFGWLIPWANKEVVTQGSSALTVGGNLPFFVDRRNGRVYRYSYLSHPDLIVWCKSLPTDPSQ